MVYKVLIVEDVDIVRGDLRQIINWEEHGYQIVGEAKNGESGLELYEKYKPHIIISDIRMPVLGGLDMLKTILEQDANVRVILLTAFEEFEYAKTALQLNIDSYILKYELDDEILLRELERQKSMIENRDRIDQIVKIDLIRRYLLEEVVPEENLNLFKWFGRSVILLINTYASAFFPIHHVALYQLFRVYLTEQVQDYEFEYIKISETEYVIVLKVPETLSSQKEKIFIREFVFSFQTFLEQSYKIKANVAGGGVFLYDSKTISEIYKKEKQLINQHVFHEAPCFLEKLQKSIDLPEHERDIQELLKTIQLAFTEFKLNAKDLLKRHISELLTELLPMTENLELWGKCVRSIFYSLSAYDEQENRQGFADRINEMTKRAYQLNVYDLCAEIMELIDQLEGSMQHKYSKRIQDAVEYIHKNCDKDITLSDLAAYLKLSGIYVSQMFKREVGMNFSSYLTKIRMKKAETLLNTGQYKVYEVCEMVGYQTVQYFSKVFKKETGKNPGDYYKRR